MKKGFGTSSTFGSPGFFGGRDVEFGALIVSRQDEASIRKKPGCATERVRCQSSASPNEGFQARLASSHFAGPNITGERIMRRYRGSIVRNPAGLFTPAEPLSEYASAAAPKTGAAIDAPAAGPFERLVKLSNEVTGIGVAIFDEHIRFVEINPTLAGLNNLPKEAHAGMPLAGIVPEVGAKLTELAHRVLDQNAPVKDLKFTARVPFVGGPLRDWLASFFPIDLGGGAAGVAHTLIEVTDQSRLEAVLADMALSPSGPAPRGGLTARETDVLNLIGLGKTTKEIAAALAISVETVGNHRKQLCRKLNLHSTAELAAYAATISVPHRNTGNFPLP